LAFAPATISKWTSKVYNDGSGTTKYNEGRLLVGNAAPDVPLYHRIGHELVMLRSLLKAGRYLCLDFGSFS
jgi:hypothetical protein